ncbi:MAG: helix-turn-helix transcriptional regulator, partial [Verrucomicrobiota bacterium]
MQRSPLLHPLAILRKIIGLTQKEMGDLVNRAARTIQSIELNKLPLTEELALRIAEATGVDEAWLFAGDPSVLPEKGVTLVNAGRGDGEYTKADYEFYRAYVETKLWDDKAFEETIKKAKAEGKQAEVVELIETKMNLMDRQKWFVENADKKLLTELELILIQTSMNENLRLARWKIRRFLDDLAKEFSIKIPKLKDSIGKNEFANFPPASE